MDNNDSNPIENLPTSSSIHHNEGSAQNAAALNIRNSLNHTVNMHDENSVRAHNMFMENMAQPSNYPYRVRNMTGAFQPHIHGVSINSDGATARASLFNSFQSPYIDRGSIHIGGIAGAGVRPNSLGGTVTSTSDIHGVTVSSDNVMGSYQIQQIDRSSMNIGGNIATGVQPSSQGGRATGTSIRSNALVLNDISMPEVHQPHNHGESIVFNNAMTNEIQSNSLHCPEQNDGSSLNLGFGVNAVAGFQSNVLGEGISNNNGRLVATQPYYFHGPQADGNILNLGGFMGDQVWSSNDSRIMCGANAGANSRPFNFVQIPQGNVQHYYPSPNDRSLGVGGNRGIRYANLYPYRGFHGYSNVASRPFNSTQPGFLANEQARLSRVALAPRIITGISNESDPTQLHPGYMNNSWRIPTFSPMVSPHVGTVGSTFRQNQSGLPVPANDASVSQATEDLDPLNKGKQVQPTKEDVPDDHPKGKRGRKCAQPARFLPGPSITSGKPIPIAGEGRLTQTSEVVLGPPVKCSKISPDSATLRIPSSKTTYQPSIKPSSASPAQSKAAYHLKWSGAVGPEHSIEENCFLCKRNLMFVPKGPVSRPSNPPAVAVLSCGHTFHDECLQLITTKEQSKDPPCIPCALGTS